MHISSGLRLVMIAAILLCLSATELPLTQATKSLFDGGSALADNGNGNGNGNGGGNGGGNGNGSGNGNGGGNSNSGGNGNGSGNSVGDAGGVSANSSAAGGGSAKAKAAVKAPRKPTAGKAIKSSQGKSAGKSKSTAPAAVTGSVLGSKSSSSASEKKSTEGKARPETAIADASASRQQSGQIVAAGLSDGDLNRLLAIGFRVEARSSGLISEPIFELSLPPNMSWAEARRVIGLVSGNALIEPNHYYYPDSAVHSETNPGACDNPACEAPQLIGWNSAALKACGTSPLIGLVDTRVDIRNPSLRGQAIETIELTTESQSPSSSQHGTAIAAILVGRADRPAPGLLPDARLVAVDAFYSEGGRDKTDVMRLVEAMELLVSRGVGVINLSLSGPPNEILQAAIQGAVAKDVVIAAAAGNNGPRGEPSFPAAFSGVVAVTAVDEELRVYGRANHGSYIALAAPGVDLWTAGSPTGDERKSGTSYAVPFVSAVASLLRSADPHLASNDVRKALETAALDLGEPGRDDTFGWGLVQMRDMCAGLIEPRSGPIRH